MVLQVKMVIIIMITVTENPTNCKKVVFTDRLSNPNDPVPVLNDNNNESSGSGAVDNNVGVEYIEPYFDTIFRHIFVNSMDETENFEMNNLDELSRKITHYEIESGINLRISKSCPETGSRIYTCVSHHHCNFRASFGPIRSSKKIILKRNHLYHNGIDRLGQYNNGANFKTRITEKITPIIAQIKKVKSDKPVANDVVKAARTLNSEMITYDQAQKVLLKVKVGNKVESTKSYELIIPYLNEFKRLNPGSTAVYDVDENSAITKIFVCPGIMNNKLRYARPIMSVDAAHLSTENKGTLYLACIKTGNDEIITDSDRNYGRE